VGDQRDARRIAVLLGLLFGLASMGSSSAAVALPAVADEFHVSIGVAAWTVSGYVLLLAVTTAVYVRGPLLFGVTLMTAGAVAAMWAPSFEVLLVARLFQGAGASAIPTLGVTVISARYAGAARGLALGWMASLGAVLSCLGPLVGGLMEAGFGWRGVMAVPILGVLTLPFLWPILTGGGSGARLDVLGAILVGLTSAGVVLLVQSPSTGLAVAGVGAVLLLLGAPLVAHRIHRHPHGFLPHAVIRNGRVVRPALAAAAAPACWFALLIAVPAVLVEDGWQTWQVGLLLLPSAVVALYLPRWAGPLLEARGGPGVIALGAALSAAAVIVAAVGLALIWPVVVGLAAVILSVAFGLGQPALMATVGDAVHVEVRGVALGVATLFFLVGGSVGSAAVAGLGGLVSIPGSVLLLTAVPVLGLLAIRTDVRRHRTA
jgi:MFS family permease